MLVAVVLITTVMFTYSAIRNISMQDQPQVMSAIDETNGAIKQLLGYTVGYYGSVLQVTANYSYAQMLASNYLQSGLKNLGNIHPEWAISVVAGNPDLHVDWFGNESSSRGSLTVTYNLTGLGISGINYTSSCALNVHILNSTAGQAQLIVTADSDEPQVDLGKGNFRFYRYATTYSTWELVTSNTAPAANANGSYQITPPSGVDPNSYLVQVIDQRGIIVIASSFTSLNYNLTWPSTTPITAIIQYVNNNTSDVDSNGDTGTHSNFTAQKYGPDNINDTLTEANTASVTYIPITFTNTRSSATPNPFQEKITWNPSSYTSYEASDLGNIRFYSDSALTTPLYAWLESCTPSLSNTATSATAWVKLTSPIAANGGTLTIYMAFLSTSTGFDGNYWGDAPNLSTTYGQYDNGANVFGFYDNFAGTTIRSAWNTAGAAGTYSVNNSLTVYSYLFPGYSLSLNNQYTGPLIVDAYQVGTVGDWIGASFSNLQTTSSSYTVTSGAVQWVYPPQGADGINGLCIASGSTAFTPSPASTTLQVVTLAVNSTTATEYQNYANPVTVSGTISLMNYPGLAQVAWSPSDTQKTYWFRLRAYPPSNVMPSASFGSVTFPILNYKLDLEEQWQNVNYTSPYQKYLCIKTGILGAETIKVDAWNGSSWINVLSNLAASSWNNASVSNLLTSSTFTMRFNGSNETSDSVQDSWQIDATLIQIVDSYSPSSVQETITLETLQNGSLRWLGQNLQLTTEARPIPPLPVKSIHINQTTNGVSNEIPFQIEDWTSNYRIPLGLTGNMSVFNDMTMLVSLINSNVSQFTIWWNGSDRATQTPFAYTNRYFTGDDPSNGKLTNGRLTLQFGSGFTLNASIGSSSSLATFMRINNQASVYGSSPAYTITKGIIRDIVQQEAEWSNGVTNCPNLYAHIVVTLPANSTYYTYQLRPMFVNSTQNRTITDFCPLKLAISTGLPQTENGTMGGYPVVVNGTGQFYNSSASSWTHHWSQFISGTKGAGIMFTDDANNKLYVFDNLVNNKTGSLKSNSTDMTMELLPVTLAPVSFQTALDVIWYGAVPVFDGTTPIYQTVNGVIGGLWVTVEYPPTIAVT